MIFPNLPYTYTHTTLSPHTDTRAAVINPSCAPLVVGPERVRSQWRLDLGGGAGRNEDWTQ